MWELAFIGALEAAVLWLTLARTRGRQEVWRQVVKACGLQAVSTSGLLKGQAALEARAGPLKVRIEDIQLQGKRGARVTIEVPGPPGFSRLGIHRDPAERWAREHEVGDESFDALFAVEGPARIARALLAVDMRRRLLGLNAECALWIAGGKLGAAMTDQQLARVLPRLVEIGRRLTEMPAAKPDLVARLAENAQRDPQAGVRLQNLQLLARELRDEPQTAEALRAACTDASPRVRLVAGRELGAEGREILAQVAEGLEDDAASAEAVALLGRELPFERLRDLLVHALGWRRIETARACLAGLGRAGGDHGAGSDRRAGAVEVLAKVAARERGELAVAAAAALGATGIPAAEPPLIAALASEQADLRVAAADALARVGSAAAVLPLKEAAERAPDDDGLRRSVRQAVAHIQSRLRGASPGQLSLTGAEAGQLSLASTEAGQLSLATDPAGQLSIVVDRAGQLSLPAGEPEEPRRQTGR